MRFFYNFITALVVFMINVNVFAQNSAFNREHNLEKQKIYVDLDKVLLDSSGIYVQNFEEWLSIQALHHDERGYYFEAKDGWACPACSHENPGEYGGELCRRCGWPIWNVRNYSSNGQSS